MSATITLPLLSHPISCNLLFFFFSDTPTTEIYTLSLHDALPIFDATSRKATRRSRRTPDDRARVPARRRVQDRKSTRLNSSHTVISYAVFCLKKKNRQLPRPEHGSLVSRRQEPAHRPAEPGTHGG